jgi:putative tryptophan/tyrosine transport system substrate-binding protein
VAALPADRPIPWPAGWAAEALSDDFLATWTEVEFTKARGTTMRRREFIAGLSLAVARPLAARAQQRRMRRIGVLMFLSMDDPAGQSEIATFQQTLRELGWAEGRNVTIDYRWGGGDPNRYRSYAQELVALAPDVIVAGNGRTARSLQQVSDTVPIVFALAPDPVGAGLIESLARPGRSTTGFGLVEYGASGKLLGLLKQIAPHVDRAAIIRDPGSAVGAGMLGAIQAASVTIGVEVRPVGSPDAVAMERGVAAFASSPNGGLVVPDTEFSFIYRELIIKLAARYRLPAVYAERVFAANGGLISYGSTGDDRYRLVAGYVDRILKGEKPADLPVQAPTKFELVINLTTAAALGIEVPETLLATADELIK